MDYLKNASLLELAAASAGLVLVRLTWQYLSKPTSKYPLPPGPKPLPVIGNLRDLPTAQEWCVYDQWSQMYGDIVYAEAPGKRFVILGSAEAAIDLLEKRSSVYSDRETAVMVHELMNWGWILGNVPYGNQWRLERRLLHKQIHINVVAQWRGIQLRSTRQFLKTLLEDSEDISSLVRNLFGVTVMDVAFGIEAAPKGDRYIAIAEEAMGLLSQAELPGAFLVDIIWPLKYVPDWFPGAGFKRVAAISRRLTQEMIDRPFKVAKDAVVNGTAPRCMTTSLLESLSHNELSEEMETALKHTTASMYAAGSDTTVSAVTCLFLAMAVYPHVLVKAHAELDSVVGRDQLPDFTHQADLPYIRAIMLELLRWQPVVPLGMPHKSTADDVYRGYFIPKGTIVIANAWGILHNPEEYPNPEEFRPERFLRTTADGKYELNPSVRDPRSVAFGWGRRICPGRHFAEQSLYAVAANVLAAFDITAPLDEEGNPMFPEVKMCSGLLSHPLPFKCVVKPRSARAEGLIHGLLPGRGL